MLRLLIVDDDVVYTRLVAIALEDVAETSAVHTLRDALTRAGDDVDVVLCDMNLPDARAAEVVAGLVPAFPRTSVVAISGVDGGNAEAALRAGAHAFLLKGGELDGALHDAVRAAAERTRALRSDTPAAPTAPTGAPAGDVADAAPVAMLGIDLEGRCTWANARLQTLTGRTRDALLGAGWQDALHPAERREVVESWHRLVAGRKEFALATRVVRTDGAILAVAITAAPAAAAGDWVAVVSDETARRAREREEANRRAQLESIINASPNPIFLKDPQDRIVLANPATEVMLERPTADVIGHTGTELIDPAQAGPVRELDLEVLRTGNARQDEMLAEGPRGELHTWLTARFPVRDADGVLTGVGVIASDISERRRLEREVERQRELLEQAQEIANLGTWEWDVAGGMMTTSRQLAEVLGVEEASPQTMRVAFEERLHPDDRAHVVTSFERSLHSSEDHDLTFRATGPDGRLRVLRARWRSRRMDGRQVLVGSTQDITQEHLREAARRAAEAQLRLVFDNAPIGLGLTDLDGRWIRVNPAACSLLGRRPAELLGTRVDDVVHPEDRAADAELLAQVLRGELDSYEFEKRCLRPDGSRLWIVFSVSAAPGADGRPDQLVLQLLDMTVRRDLEARLTELADVDAVTGLPNARRLHAELERAITWRRRSGESATLLLVELAGYAAVAEHAGHTAGERVLRDLGTALRRSVRRTDIVVRADDARFALLLPDTTRAATETVMRKLAEAVAADELPGPPLFGVVELTSGSTTPDELLRTARAALDAARDAARDPRA